ncbi:MAG: hypothetical protein JWM95_840 [Gemmatimonadetes bacterium]|nr:hypothetical protein [Gemmatimonadota bacterium]
MMDHPDFGEDADVELPGDEQFDAWVSARARSLNVPPATPRLEMWDAIASTQKTSAIAQTGGIAGVLPFRISRRFLPVAIAAALLLGVGIDRVLQHEAIVVPPPVASQPVPPADPSRLYHMAAVQTLSQAEALLTAFRASDVAVHDPAAARQLGAWGRDVLSSTRLLIDSPAGADPQLRPLLNDLELVLVQVISLSGAPLDSSDRKLIDQTLHDRDLLPRIRTAVPAGIGGTASDE